MASGFKFIIVLSLLFCATVFAEQDSGENDIPPEFKSLDDEVRALKKDTLQLNRELFILEEELLFPTNTQVAIFLSINVAVFFQLDSVQIKIDDKVVSNYLYTKHELDSLRRGGIHRAYFGNLRTGEHELVALFTGTGPKGREYHRGANLVFDKNSGPKYIELKILDDEKKQQPEFTIKEWE